MENCPDLRGLRQIVQPKGFLSHLMYGELPRLEGITTLEVGCFITQR